MLLNWVLKICFKAVSTHKEYHKLGVIGKNQTTIYIGNYIDLRTTLRIAVAVF